MISIIIRTKNEERWIGPCLKKIYQQKISDKIEIILVDNNSHDKTIHKAKSVCPDLKLVNIENFKPGFAINKGIRVSNGDYIVVLSAHCLPVKQDWLNKMKNNLQDNNIAGVYGRQIPHKYTNSLDKRDLLVTFGLDKRVQEKDSFFHNANSMFKKEIWEKFPFNERVTNIEDRIWARDVIDAGYKIIYEPDAPVYHYHGIHQAMNPDRANSVIRIMEGLESIKSTFNQNPIDLTDTEIAAFIPLRLNNKDIVDHDIKLLEKTINAVQSSKHVKTVFLLPDSNKIEKYAKRFNAIIPFIRPKSLSQKNVRVNDVFKYSLEKIEKNGYFPDLIVTLDLLYPMRPNGIIDKMIEHLVNTGYDTVLPGYTEYRPCWKESDNNKPILLDNYDEDIKMDKRSPLNIGLIGLGCVTYPEIIRDGKRIGDKVGLIKIENPIATLELRNPRHLDLFHGIEKLYYED